MCRLANRPPHGMVFRYTLDAATEIWLPNSGAVYGFFHQRKLAQLFTGLVALMALARPFTKCIVQFIGAKRRKVTLVQALWRRKQGRRRAELERLKPCALFETGYKRQRLCTMHLDGTANQMQA